MDEPRSCTEPVTLPAPAWGDLRWLALLFVLTAGLRVWQVANTEIASRDSIAYIRFAWRLDHEPWPHVIKTEIHHPGYGFLIYLVSKPVRAVIEDLPRAMRLSAQLASSLASLLLLVPMYYLGKELFDRRVGFWAALFFQVLPSSSRLMPDGLSEAPFLFWVASALCFVSRGLTTGRAVWYVLAGLLTGLAYLTRTEGLLLIPVTVLVLLALQRGRLRRPWPALRRESLALVAACVLVVGPFMYLIGGISQKASFKHITDTKGWEMPAAPARAPAAIVNLPIPLAIWWLGPDVAAKDRYGWAAWALVVILDKAFFHVFGPLALLGLWVFRRRFFEAPIAAVMLAWGLVLLPLLWRLGQSAGYIGERHVMLIVMGGLYFAVAAIGWLAARLVRQRYAWITLALLVGLAGACLPKSLARLHGNRTGLREAGEWLAANSRPGDSVFDPLGWASYHAGRYFASADAQRSDPTVCYVVLERSKNKHPHLWYLMDVAEDVARRGEVVHRLEPRKGITIEIYRVRRPEKSTPPFQLMDDWLEVSLRRKVTRGS